MSRQSGGTRNKDEGRSRVEPPFGASHLSSSI